MKIQKTLVEECKIKLLDEKSKIINRLLSVKDDFNQRETSGDEADQCVSSIQESQFLINTTRLRTHLLEVESALMRIENGTFGLCEQTQDFIEERRLKAVPWTRFSIEGAEIKEELSKRFA